MKKLQDKTVFITGGLSGIGKACAFAAAKEGANVAIADLKLSSTEKTMEEIRLENPKAIFIECDISDYKQVERAINKVVDTFSSLDVALNNAGVSGDSARLADLSGQSWSKVINVNLTGTFNCMKYELKQMSKQKKGVIINLSSIAGKVGFANSSHYVASKHGIIGLTRSAALEYASEGIRINAICPGVIETPMVVGAGIIGNPDVEKYMISLHPIGRFGKPEEIASGFIFLASDESSFVTGTTLDIDGGYLTN